MKKTKISEKRVRRMLAGSKLIISLFILFQVLLFDHSSYAMIPETIDQISLRIRTPEEVALWFADHFESRFTFPDKARTILEILESKQGDCEDFAILAAAVLTRNGIENEVIVLKFGRSRIYHAVCIFKYGDGTYGFIENRELFKTSEMSVKAAAEKFYPDCTEILKIDDIRKKKWQTTVL